MNVVLADDHQIMRQGLRAVLEKEADLVIVGEASDGREAIEVVRRLHPRIVVMDVSMRGLNGIEATRVITAEAPRTKVVALSMNADKRYVHAMFDAGASAYVLKTCASVELVSAIRAADGDGAYVSPAVAGTLIDEFRQRSTPTRLPAVPELTAREREVLQLVAEGLTSKEVAARLGVAPSTVESHRKQIAAKLGASSVADLTKLAIRLGLTSVD
jgi:DNA-binding NarL/FixJ family response regulator